MAEDFWLPKPKPPSRDSRAWSLMLPALASAVGFCLFAVLGYAFTEMELLPVAFRVRLVVLGAITVAIGGEVGTLTSTVEIFRKVRSEEVSAWDWSALVASSLSSLGIFLMAFATLLGVKATWSEWAKMYGPIIIGLLGVPDAYANFAELGLYLSTYDKRMRAWETDFHDELFQRARREKEMKRPTTDEEKERLVRAFTQLFSAAEPATGEEIDEELRSMGYDPEKVGAKIRAAATKALELARVSPPAETQLSDESPTSLCFCGTPCASYSAYLDHVRSHHYQESMYSPSGERYQNAVTALEAMRGRYAATLARATWGLPSLDTVREWRQEARRAGVTKDEGGI